MYCVHHIGRSCVRRRIWSCLFTPNENQSVSVTSVRIFCSFVLSLIFYPLSYSVLDQQSCELPSFELLYSSTGAQVSPSLLLPITRAGSHNLRQPLFRLEFTQNRTTRAERMDLEIQQFGGFLSTLATFLASSPIPYLATVWQIARYIIEAVQQVGHCSLKGLQELLISPFFYIRPNATVNIYSISSRISLNISIF